MSDCCFPREGRPFAAGVTSQLARLLTRPSTAASKQRSWRASPLLFVHSTSERRVCADASSLTGAEARAFAGRRRSTSATSRCVRQIVEDVVSGPGHGGCRLPIGEQHIGAGRVSRRCGWDCQITIAHRP